MLLSCFLTIHGWTVPTCSMNDKRYKHELDMLSRFTGHDHFDWYAKNWMRQRASKKTYHLPPTERVRDVCVRDGHTLELVGTTRQWRIDLETCDVQAGQTLDPKRRYFLSPHRLYETYYDPEHRHVIDMDGQPLAQTDAYPYFVRESLDGTAALVGLCAEEMMIVKMDRQGSPSTVTKLSTDVTLASVSSNHLVFNGLFNGQLVVHDLLDAKESRYGTSDAAFNSIRSLEAESLGSTVLLYIGFQDGCVKCVKYDPFLTSNDHFHEVFVRNMHGAPVSRIRMSSGRVVSCDESGRVIVTDLHAVQTMYNLECVAGPEEETLVDITDRYLVVARANKVHVWDHGVENELPRRPHEPKPRNRGGGGKLLGSGSRH